MKKVLDIKNEISEDSFYEIKLFVENTARKKFDYLGLRFQEWENLAVSLLERAKKDNGSVDDYISYLSVGFERVVKAYVLRQLEEKNSRIFDNLLIKINRICTNKELVLKRFIRELEILEVYLDKDSYNWLKNNSAQLKRLLNILDLFPLSLNMLLKKLDITIVKPRSEVKKNDKGISSGPYKSIYKRFSESEFVQEEERKIIVDYLLSQISEEKSKKVLDYFSRESSLKYKEINSIFASLKAQYLNFINIGCLPGESLELENLYTVILMRKSEKYFINDLRCQDIEVLSNLIGDRISKEKKGAFINDLIIIGNIYVNNGYSKLEFLDITLEIFKLLDSLSLSEIEYIRSFNEKAFAKLGNNDLARV